MSHHDDMECGVVGVPKVGRIGNVILTRQHERGRKIVVIETESRIRNVFNDRRMDHGLSLIHI